MQLSKYAKIYRDELINSVIPFWENNCIDKQYGGFFTFLDRNGSVYDTRKFMWMQWRIVYMFTILYLKVDKRPHWLKIAEDGASFLINNGKNSKNAYYFALSRDGRDIVSSCNIFSECFAAMGCAVLYNATNNELYYNEAKSSLDKYIKRMDNPKGRWDKSGAYAQQYLNLGHFMMLINLGKVAESHLNEYTLSGQVDSAVEMVMRYFFNSDYGILFENITEKKEFDFKSCDGRHINPGHGLESLWFCLEYAEQKKDSKLIEKICGAIVNTLEFSWDRDFGGIYYFMDILKRPHFELQADMKLWWPHNEALIACAYAWKLSNNDVFAKWFEKIHDYTWSHFPDSEYGEWFAYLNRRGEIANKLKGGKWKTMFHLPRALQKCHEILKVK